MEYEEQPQRNMTVQYNLFKQKKQYVQYESIHCWHSHLSLMEKNSFCQVEEPLIPS